MAKRDAKNCPWARKGNGGGTILAKGPPWSEWEDSVLEAARQVRVPYRLIHLVLPNRSPAACKIRADILRRKRGIPSRDYAHLEQLRWRMNAQRGSQMLAEALNRTTAVNG